MIRRDQASWGPKVPRGGFSSERLEGTELQLIEKAESHWFVGQPGLHWIQKNKQKNKTKVQQIQGALRLTFQGAELHAIESGARAIRVQRFQSGQEPAGYAGLQLTQGEQETT